MSDKHSGEHKTWTFQRQPAVPQTFISYQAKYEYAVLDIHSDSNNTSAEDPSDNRQEATPKSQQPALTFVLQDNSLQDNTTANT